MWFSSDSPVRMSGAMDVYGKNSEDGKVRASQ